MKMLGLLVTTALALPLGACIARDNCDPPGWCNDKTPTQVCFDDHDCAHGYVCDGGSCVVHPPVPPPRGQGGTAGYGGAAGAGGSRQVDGGIDSGGGGAGGSRPLDGGTGLGGAGHVDGGGSGGTGQPPSDGGIPPTCDGGGGGASGGCHVHPTPVCQFDHQCGLTGRCVDGECQAACTSNTDCGTGQVCGQGYCITPATSGGQCIFNADCGSGKTCINGTCHSDCQTDGNCPAHDRCLAGICQPDTGPRPQCLSNGDCVGVHITEDVCVDAVCRTECLSDVDCCVGSSGSICQMGYCVTAHEVAPQCAINADCGVARSCIDATCG
jgi:hypothetical protein